MQEKGFTLVELVILLILVSILAAIAAPRFLDLINPSKENVTKHRLEELRKAIVGNPDVVAGGTYSARGFRGDVCSFPSVLADLVLQGAYPAWNKYTRKGWNGPYVDSSGGQYLLDAWGNGFTYSSTCSPPTYPTITSYGSDGVAGGSGDAADIVVTLRYGSGC